MDLSARAGAPERRFPLPRYSSPSDCEDNEVSRDCDLRCRDVLLDEVVLKTLACRRLRVFGFECLAMASSSSEDEGDSIKSESQVG